MADLSNRRLRDYVASILIEVDDDPNKIVDRLITLAETDQGLRDKLVRLGADRAARDYFTGMRSSAASLSPLRALLPNDEINGRITARIARVEFWHRYTLYGKVRLADATRPLLIDSARLREIQAEGNRVRAAFERRVASVLPDDIVMVKDSVTERRVYSLAEEVGAAD